MYKLDVNTSGHSQMIDITDKVRECVKNSGVTDGICMVYVPHTTAAVTINENADPDVVRDMMSEMDKIVPWTDGYHHFEGNSAAHIKSSMFGFSEHIIIEGARLILGRWQGIYFCEFDGARSRSVYVKIIEG